MRTSRPLDVDGVELDVARLSKTSSVEPSMIVSPCSSFARSTRLPFTSMPFVESRSTSHQVAPSLPHLRVPARDVRVVEPDVALARAAEHDHGASSSACGARPRRARALAARARARSGARPRSAAAAGGLVDHRRAGLDLGGGLVGRGPRRASGWTIRVAIPNSPIARSSSVSISTFGGDSSA